MADDVFTSPFYELLEAALARYEAAGHLAEVALTALAPNLTPCEGRADPAAELADMLDQSTQRLWPGQRTRARVAELIPTPAESIANDMRAMLAQRQGLIETAAWQLARDAQKASAEWVNRLGKLPTQPRSRKQWLAHAGTNVLNRHQYELTGPWPLDDPQVVRGPDQPAKY